LPPWAAAFWPAPPWGRAWRFLPPWFSLSCCFLHCLGCLRSANARRILPQKSGNIWSCQGGNAA